MTLKLRRVWLILGFGFVFFVVYISLTPTRPDLGGPAPWKVGHVLAYIWLMFWYSQLYASLSTRIVLAVLFCSMGVGLEYLQGLTDYRTFAYFDMLLNSCGVAIGFMLGYTPLQHMLASVESWMQALLPKS